MLHPLRVAVAFVLGGLMDTSLAQSIDRNSLSPIRPEQWSAAHAAHLARRAGFGASPEENDKLVALGPQAAVESFLEFASMPYQPSPPPFPAELYQSPDRAELRNLSPEERERLAQERRQREREAFEETRLWWIERMVESPRPLEEKMTLFWHGHFTSGMREVRDAVFMKEQNDFLRANALGNFGELLLGVSRDRAMLVYLDGAKNHKSKPNENYARELLELFSLGVGAYSETDIKEAARAFTGWDFDESGFVFRKGDHDFGPKKFLGESGNFDGGDIVRIVLEQPACARFLATKLLKFFCHSEPQRELVDRLSARIRQCKYEMKPVLQTLFLSEAFYCDASRGSLVKSPAELLIGTARQLAGSIENLRVAERALAAMGQELMQPPNVKGWNGGAAWINTATLFTRYNAVVGLLNGGGGRPRRLMANDEAPESEETGMTRSAAPAARSRINGGQQAPFEPASILRNRNLDSAEAVVDFFSERLLAGPLPPEKRELLIQYLLAGGKKFRKEASWSDERVRSMLCLMLSTPEYQMN